MHADAVALGHRVLVVDDLIATGGTAAATVRLAREAKAEVLGCTFLIELKALGGRGQLGVERTHVILDY
jgi:adenine phosphoribosyltransferase